MLPILRLLLVFAGLTLSAQGELRIASGITPNLNVFQRIQAAFEKASGVKLVLVDARSPAAWEMLDKGQVDAAAAGLSWEDWAKSIRDKKLRMPEEAEVRRFQIGSDKIQVLTHGETLILNLEKDQLVGIFTGKILNWKDVGGEDAPIKVVLDPNQIATSDVFRSRILDGSPFLADGLAVPAGNTLLQVVESTPHAIGFAPKATIRSQKVNSPITPDVYRPILLLIKGQRPAPNVQKLLDFLASSAGKALVVD